MSVVVAGLFDEQAAATQAMDEVLRMRIDDLDSRVIETQGNQQAGADVGGVIPVIPNTSGGMSQSGPGVGAGGGMAAAPLFGRRDFDWISDEEERGFYYEGAREGATFAMVKVSDEHADHIRQIFRQYGARTFKKD